MSADDAASRVVNACFEGDAEVVGRELAVDARLARTSVPWLGSTPLHVSAHRGFLPIVELLLEHGADPHAREGCSATTPLHWAAEAGHLAVAERLVARGAALDPRDSWHDQTPLDWALWVVRSPHYHDDRPAVAAWLEEQGAVPSLFAAVATGRGAAVREHLVRDRSALTSRLGPVDHGLTPLAFAVARGLTSMVALLLELGADPDAPERGFSSRALGHLGRRKDVQTAATPTSLP